MTDSITITGLVASPPKHFVTGQGIPITSFRLASTQRRFDRSNQRWIDGDTNWYSISSFRQLAINCAGSINKGDRILLTGRLRIREWDNGEKAGTSIDIDAETIGHDLTWGTAVFARVVMSSASFPSNAESEAARPDAAGKPALSEPEPEAESSHEAEGHVQPAGRELAGAEFAKSDDEVAALPF